MTIKWNKSYAVGIKMFDEHHEKLIGLLNALEASAKKTARTSNKAVVNALKDLLDYSVYHFAAEETLLTTHNYPNLQQQKDEHKKFTTKIENFTSLYLAGSEPEASDVISFLTEWSLHHIREVDRSYAGFLREKGIR